MSLTDIERASICLNMLMLEHPFATSTVLVDRISGHYKQQVQEQLLTLVGSFDILGNPIGLIDNLGTGFVDLFHEPAKGLVKSPGDFGSGVSRGVQSLVRNSVFGIANSFSKVSGSLGSGVALMSMDSTWRAERNRNRRTERPSNISDGVLLV